jgi:hypothetical protein
VGLATPHSAADVRGLAHHVCIAADFAGKAALQPGVGPRTRYTGDGILVGGLQRAAMQMAPEGATGQNPCLLVPPGFQGGLP